MNNNKKIKMLKREWMTLRKKRETLEVKKTRAGTTRGRGRKTTFKKPEK